MFRAVRSSGLIFLNVVLILVFGVAVAAEVEAEAVIPEVIDLIPTAASPEEEEAAPALAVMVVVAVVAAFIESELAASISNSSFKLPFLRLRSSSFQSILPRLRRLTAPRLLLLIAD